MTPRLARIVAPSGWRIVAAYARPLELVAVALVVRLAPRSARARRLRAALLLRVVERRREVEEEWGRVLQGGVR